jgi:hypothetical protein
MPGDSTFWVYPVWHIPIRIQGLKVTPKMKQKQSWLRRMLPWPGGDATMDNLLFLLH